MTQFRWPLIIITCVVALAVFFGANHLRQRFLEEEPFIEALMQLSGIEVASISREGDREVLQIVPDPHYTGTLQDLVSSVKEEARIKYRKPLTIHIQDKRNERLAQFARRVTPVLFEAVRLHNYRSADQAISAVADEFGLEALHFAVDFELIYLQARDGDHYLYEVIRLECDEGGGA